MIVILLIETAASVEWEYCPQWLNDVLATIRAILVTIE
jgi:hypothetical protein